MPLHKTVFTVRPAATAAMILGTVPAPPLSRPQKAAISPSPPPADAQELPSDLVQFREDICRRDQVPFRTAWPDDGLAAAGRLHSQSHHRYQILVVDDEPGVCKAIKLLLGIDGHEVHTVASGEEALALLEQHHFDVIITDYSVWGMNGDQLTAHIKQFRPAQPIIMATADADDFNVGGKSTGGADWVIKKPFSRKDLRDALSRVMR